MVINKIYILRSTLFRRLLIIKIGGFIRLEIVKLLRKIIKSIY